MMAANVAVARLRSLPVCGLVLENLQVGAGPQTVKADLSDERARMNTEVGAHPIVVAALATERVNVHRTEHIDEEAVRLLQIRHREADVVDSAQAESTATATFLRS